MVAGRGDPNLDIGLEQAKAIIAEGTPDEVVADRKVLVLTPDATRTCPLPRMISAVKEVIGSRAKRLDFMVALGSHHPLEEDRVLKLYGINQQRRTEEFGDSSFFWDKREWLWKTLSSTKSSVFSRTSYPAIQIDNWQRLKWIDVSSNTLGSALS